MNLPRMGIETSLEADAFALQKLAGYANGKIILWSWVSRGLVDMQWLADLRHGGDVNQATESLSGVKGKLAALCHFDELPILDGAPETADESPQDTLMNGQIITFWAISEPNSGADPIPLPLWMRASIDQTILQWKDLAEKWNGRLAKRQLQGKDFLPEKAQKGYNAFFASNVRTIVLDKIKQSLVVNFSTKSINKLKKTCILLNIHMSEDPESLRVTTGCGKLWSLKLLQSSTPVSEILPAAVDHFEGQLVYRTVLYSAVQE